MLFGSIDVTHKTNDANYVAIEVNRYIAIVNPPTIVQVYFDNATAMKNAN